MQKEVHQFCEVVQPFPLRFMIIDVVRISLQLYLLTIVLQMSNDDLIFCSLVHHLVVLPFYQKVVQSFWSKKVDKKIVLINLL